MKLPAPYARILSTCIKISIVGIAAVYIYRKAARPEYNELFEWPDAGAGFWMALALLTVLNWFLETWKWKYLAASLEPISWGRAAGGVLAGITMGIATPNRTGEFVGRIFSLRKSAPADVFFVAAVGSFFQFLVTLLCGLAGFLLLQNAQRTQLLDRDFPLMLYSVLVGVIILLLLLFLFSATFRKRVFALPFLKKYAAKEKIYSSLQQARYLPVFLLSLGRYLVFASQFVMLLYVYGMHPEPVQAYAAVALTYLVVTIVPSFALTEVVVRGSAAVAIIGSFSGNERGALLASLLLWIINIALPALPGIYFVWRLRFFKTPADAG